MNLSTYNKMTYPNKVRPSQKRDRLSLNVQIIGSTSPLSCVNCQVGKSRLYVLTFSSIRRYLSLLLLFICLQGMQSVSAQTMISVKDGQNQQPLAGVQIHLFEKDHKSYQTTYTDQRGFAEVSNSVNTDVDSFFLEVDYLGYLDWSGWVQKGKVQVINLDPQTFDLDQVVVTGQYMPQSAEKAVQKIRVIDRTQIDRMAAVNLKDVLANQLQIRISEDLILGSSMRIQGLSGENVKILIDGIPMIGRLDGDLDLRQINLHDIERIEIIEGPMSVNFGTNALAGTINLITKEAEGTKQQGNTYMESTGTFNTHLSTSHRFRQHQFHVSGMRNFFSGWRPDQPFIPNFDRQIADTSRFKQWKPREQLQGNWGYATKWLGLQWKYRGSIFDEFILNRGIPRMPYRETAFDDEYHTTRIDHSISIEGFINDRWRMNMVASSNLFKREKYTFIKNLTNLERQVSSLPGDQDSARFNQIMSRGSISRLHPKYKIEIGYDIQREVNQGPRILDDVRSIEDYALFSTAEITLWSSLIIRPGFRWAYNSQYQAPLLPSLHVKNSWGNTTLRASYARGFRAPGLKELYFFFVDINHNIQGNPNLQAETSHNFTVNLQQNLPWIAPSLSIEGGLFYNNIQNLITLAQSTEIESLFTYFNIGTYTSLGGQIQAKYNHKQISVAIGTSTNGLSNSLSRPEGNTQFLFNQEWNGQLNYQWIKTGLDFSLFFKHQGRLPGFVADTEGNVSERFIGAYNLADMTISKNFFKEALNISFGCKNIFNVRNVEASTTLGPHSTGANSLAIGMGRYLFLGIQYNIM